jgi:hypothetical protein
MWLLYLIGGFYTFLGLVWVFDRINQIPTDIKEKKRLADLAEENRTTRGRAEERTRAF